MKLESPFSLAEIASLLGLPHKGESDLSITGINEIHRHSKGDLIFVDYHKYYDQALNSQATAVLIDREVDFPPEKGIIISENPFRDFNFLLNYFNPFEFPPSEKGENIKVGKNSKIHPSVSIGNNVSIGENTMIFPNVVIHDDVSIGDRVIIQSGTVIGSMGFYYKNREKYYDRLLSSGKVEIESKVEIGANCTIDRGVTAETLIGEGSKIDNQVQIGHDSIIGKHCLIAAQSGIAGCVTIGDHCTLWGQVGIASGINIGGHSVIGAKSGVSKSLKGGATYIGVPAANIKVKYKEQAFLKKMLRAEGNKSEQHGER